MTHLDRLGCVTAALAERPASISALSRTLRWPVSSVWLAVHELLRTGKVVFHGEAPNPAPQGGRNQKLYRLAGSTVHHKPIDLVGKQLKNSARTEWKQRRHHAPAGSGVVAGRITIGRGSVWGAGRA
jgi:hypothetical protein